MGVVSVNQSSLSSYLLWKVSCASRVMLYTKGKVHSLYCSIKIFQHNRSRNHEVKGLSMDKMQVCKCVRMQMLATWTRVFLAVLCSMAISSVVVATDINTLELQQQVQHRRVVYDSIASGVAGRSLQRGAVERFTIVPHYDTSVNELSLQQQRVLKKVVMESAIQWFSDTLKVRPMATNIKFERKCSNAHYLINGLKYCRGSCAPVTKCGPVTIPDQHLMPCRMCARPGVVCEGEENGDGGNNIGVRGGHFLLYVSAHNEAHCTRVYGTKLVEAKHCLQEESFDRPVAGYINFCPQVLSADSAHIALQQHAVIHELVHALVFSEDLFPYYHNEEGYPRSRRTADRSIARYPTGGYDIDQNTLRLVRKSQWTAVTPNISHRVQMIVTPNVVHEVRDHFNCPSMIGAELENQGGLGVAGAHWESRLFREELMTATLNDKPVFSRITMALMQDSGWYLPDYSYAGNLLWGQEKGCPFVESSCGGWMEYANENREPQSPFCDGQDYKRNRMGCVNGRTGLGPCLIRNYTIPLPLDYQYLSRRRGGTQVLADYCPLYGSVEYGEFRLGASCLNPDHAPSTEDNVAQEVYSAKSRCFDQAEPLKRVEGEDEEIASYQGVGCYQFYCTARRVHVLVGGQDVRCGRKGRKQGFEYEINGVTYRGSILCPAYSDVCAEYDCINNCSYHGSCSKGECKCDYGYFGEDCSQSYAQRLLSCDSVTCQNGGRCTDSADGAFNCSCLSGFTGAFCEQEMVSDPCVNVTCNEHGLCTRTQFGLSAQCNCYRGYKGRECGLFEDLCAVDDKPCLNNRSCIVNTTQCDCGSAYWGTQCEKRVDFCTPTSPCGIGEICTHHNLSQTYTCTCPEGYTGENCTGLRIDYCADSPCLNNGTCVNNLDGFKCLCARGYKGGRCKNRENPCKVSPCSEGGRCRRVEDASWGQVYCRCNASYTGELCETHLGVSL